MSLVSFTIRRKYLGLFLLLSSAFRPVAQESYVSGGTLLPEQANMDIRHYLISLDVDPQAQSIAGFTEIRMLLKDPATAILLDLVDPLQVSRVTVDGKTATFSQHKNRLSITGTRPWTSGAHAVKVFYAGKPPVARRPPWEGGFQWEKDSSGKSWVAISCQQEGGKVFFACKDHPSDKPDEGAELMISVPRGLVVAGPGLLKKTETKKGKSVFHWQTRYPISTYNLVFNAGDYKVVKKEYTTVRGNRVPIEFYVLAANADRAARHLAIMERSAKVQEKYFDEYPWVREKIGIVETPHLGMEHQTMNAYGNKFRYTQVGGQDFDWLMHHEFGHEWWGNKVTNSDWAHMWIQEGICVYGDGLYIRETEGEDAHRAWMRQRALASQNKKPVVQGEVVDSKETYQADIYGKGAFFMHSLRFVIGDSIFFPALKELATRPEFTFTRTINTDDVERHFSKAAGRSLKPLFDLYLRTIERIEVRVKQTATDKYRLQVLAPDMVLPLEVQTERGREKLMVGKEGIEIQSTILPIIDPEMYYLRRIVIE